MQPLYPSPYEPNGSGSKNYGYRPKADLWWVFKFNGRAGRLYWWMAQIVGTFVFALSLEAALVIDGADKGADQFDNRILEPSGWCVLALVVLSFLYALFILASNAKRLHDRGKSAAWIVIALVPVLGYLWIVIELGFFPGQRSSNRYD